MKRPFLPIVSFLLLIFLAIVPYATAGTVIYTYDTAGRLIKADYGEGKTIEYTYDNAENLLRQQVSSPSTTMNNKSNPSARDALIPQISINNLSTAASQVVDPFLGLRFPYGIPYFLDSSLVNLLPGRLDDTWGLYHHLGPFLDKGSVVNHELRSR